MDERFFKASKFLETLSLEIPDPEFKIDVNSICVFTIKAGEWITAHKHSFPEAHYIVQGAGKVIFDQKEFILSPGDFYITGPGVVHAQYSSDTAPLIEYGFKGDFRLLRSSYNEKKPIITEYSFIANALNSIEPVILKDVNGIRELFEEIFIEAADLRPGYLSRIRHLFWELIIASARNAAMHTAVSYSPPLKDKVSSRLQLLDCFLHDNMHRKILASELTRQFAISEKQLNRFIKAQTGLSLHNYILQKKVEKAVELITGTDEKLSAVADYTGFCSEFHLSRVIKRITSYSPSDLRRPGTNLSTFKE